MSAPISEDVANCQDDDERELNRLAAISLDPATERGTTSPTFHMLASATHHARSKSDVTLPPSPCRTLLRASSAAQLSWYKAQKSLSCIVEDDSVGGLCDSPEGPCDGHYHLTRCDICRVTRRANASAVTAIVAIARDGLAGISLICPPGGCRFTCSVCDTTDMDIDYFKCINQPDDTWCTMCVDKIDDMDNISRALKHPQGMSILNKYIRIYPNTHQL